jgi:hypothetical protein
MQLPPIPLDDSKDVLKNSGSKTRLMNCPSDPSGHFTACQGSNKDGH